MSLVPTRDILCILTQYMIKNMLLLYYLTEDRIQELEKKVEESKQKLKKLQQESSDKIAGTFYS